MTPREANHNSHSQAFQSKLMAQPDTYVGFGTEFFCIPMWERNASYACKYWLTRASIGKSAAYNSRWLICVGGTSWANQARGAAAGQRLPRNTRSNLTNLEQLFSRCGRTSQGLTSRSARTAPNATPTCSSKASASRTPAQRLRSWARSSAEQVLRGGAAAARVAHNHQVTGSSPVPATRSHTRSAA